MYRAMVNAHALNMVLRPVDIPEEKLAVYPFEIHDSIPIIFDYVPEIRQEVVYEDHTRDINELYIRKQGTDIQKPPAMYWMGNPV